MANFGRYTSQYMKSPDRLTMGLKDFYFTQSNNAEPRMAMANLNLDATEYAWHNSERTYYRIYPDYCNIFSQIKLGKIPVSEIRLPQPVFALHLPMPDKLNPDKLYLTSVLFAESLPLVDGMMDEIAEHYDEPRKKAFSVTHSNLGKGFTDLGFTSENTRMFILVPRLSDGGTPMMSAPFCGAKSVAENAEILVDMIIAQSITGEQDSPIKFSNIELSHLTPDVGDHRGMSAVLNTLLRLCLSTSFLATGADKIIEPDILGKDWPRYNRALDAGDEEAAKRLIGRAARRRNQRGFVVGRMSQLPRTTSFSSGDGEGHSLQHQHQRCGHFHGFHSNTGYKIKWVNQLTVRPDLPPDARQKGYST